MYLRELVAQYALSHDLSDRYVKNLYTAARHFTEFAGEVPLEDITASSTLGRMTNRRHLAHDLRITASRRPTSGPSGTSSCHS